MVARSEPALKNSPLHARHVELGAKFAEFGGWSMPVEYTGSVKEHLAVRAGVGVFDVSHLGTVLVTGEGAAAYLNACLTNDLRKIGPGQAQYSLCCSDDGGVVDDLIAYLRGDGEVFLIPNAANTAKVVELLTARAPRGVTVVNRSGDYAVLAVQGPASDETVAGAGFPVGHDYMSFVEVEHDTASVVVCRTGYTGERGYELVVPVEAAGSVWDSVMASGADHGIVAAGLAARDTLRTEMGYPLHGQDITLQITPLEARLGWAVGWDKEHFWGDERLRAQRERGASRFLRGLVAKRRGIPRPRMAVSALDGTRVGEVTSGTYSPTRKQGVALALLDARVTKGDEVMVDVRGRQEPFVVTPPPFVTPGVRGEP